MYSTMQTTPPGLLMIAAVQITLVLGHATNMMRYVTACGTSLQNDCSVLGVTLVYGSY